VLLDYDAKKEIVIFRHYRITLTPSKINKTV
jgi:hypothetical protein